MYLVLVFPGQASLALLEKKEQFSKQSALVSSVLSAVSLFPLSSMPTLTLIMSFVLLLLDLICCSFTKI